MTTFEKLKIKIEKDCDLVVTDFRRTYAGYNQREEGAWRWCAKSGNSTDVGSQYPASYLLKCKKVELYKSDWGDIEILPLEI